MNQTAQASKLDQIVKNTVKHKYIFGAVAHVTSGEGAFSWLGAAGNMDETDPYFIASTTKIYITAILLHLRSQGQLQLDDKISQYLPKDLLSGIHVYKGKEYSYDITIRQLMAQTSGLPDYFGDQQKDGKSLQAEITQGNDQAWTLAQVLHRAKQMKPKFLPGTKGKAYYSDTNYQLLGKIIETITNESLHAALKKYVFDPLRLSNTYLYTDATDNSPKSLYYKSAPLTIPLAMTSFGPDGGIVSTARESMTFLRAFFNGEFFPVAYLPELKVWNKIFFPLQYGVGMARCKMPRIFSPFQPLPEIIGHSGLSGAFAYYCPEKDLYLTGTVNQVAQPSLSYQFMFKLIAAYR